MFFDKLMNVHAISCLNRTHKTTIRIESLRSAQPPAATLLAAATAAVGLLPGDQDLGMLFILGMVLSLSGVMQFRTDRDALVLVFLGDPLPCFIVCFGKQDLERFFRQFYE